MALSGTQLVQIQFSGYAGCPCQDLMAYQFVSLYPIIKLMMGHKSNMHECLKCRIKMFKPITAGAETAYTFSTFASNLNKKIIIGTEAQL